MSFLCPKASAPSFGTTIWNSTNLYWFLSSLCKKNFVLYLWIFYRNKLSIYGRWHSPPCHRPTPPSPGPATTSSMAATPQAPSPSSPPPSPSLSPPPPIGSRPRYWFILYFLTEKCYKIHNNWLKFQETSLY